MGFGRFFHFGELSISPGKGAASVVEMCRALALWLKESQVALVRDVLSRGRGFGCRRR